MTTQHDKAKRWRPKFSVRTLVIVVTLVCCYLGLWKTTKSQGVEDVKRHIDKTYFVGRDYSAVVPLVVSYRGQGPPGMRYVHRHYYLWFFGYVAKLPWEREIADTSLPMLPYRSNWSGIVPPPYPIAQDAESVAAREELVRRLESEVTVPQPSARCPLPRHRNFLRAKCTTS
jgi:hypothetical protein